MFLMEGAKAMCYIIIKCTNALNTLIDYKYKPHCIAKDGKPGMKKKKTGKNGDNFIINVHKMDKQV